jgi:hypothetical protein
MDGNGNLFGTTGHGGITQCNNGSCDSWGTVYEVSPSGQQGGAWSEKVIYAFTRQNGDGYYPISVPVADSSGALYATTINGGLGDPNQVGPGIVFQLTNTGGTWVETVLFDFDGTDGVQPGNLVLEGGAVYGTTEMGGYNGGSCPVGCGVVFELNQP